MSDSTDDGRRRAISYLALSAGLTLVGLMAPRHAHAAYGKCYKCNCCGFEGSENNCSNCGHRYEDHTGQTCDQEHVQRGAKIPPAG
jgi:hypothetical protein